MWRIHHAPNWWQIKTIFKCSFVDYYFNFLCLKPVITFASFCSTLCSLRRILCFIYWNPTQTNLLTHTLPSLEFWRNVPTAIMASIDSPGFNWTSRGSQVIRKWPMWWQSSRGVKALRLRLETCQSHWYDKSAKWYVTHNSMTLISENVYEINYTFSNYTCHWQYVWL